MIPLEAGGDDDGFFDNALTLSQGTIPSVPYHAYSVLLSWLFSVFGPSVLTGKLLNSLLASLSITVAVAITDSVCVATSIRERKTLLWRCALLLMCYPTELFFTAQLYKDSVILFTGNLFVLGYLSFRSSTSRNKKISIMMWSTGALLVLLLFRPYAAVGLVFAIGIHVFLQWRLSTQTKLGIAVISALAVFFIPLALGFGPAGSSVWLSRFDLNEAQDFRTRLYSSQGSSLGIQLDPSAPLSFLLNYNYSCVTVALGPFPWQILNKNVLLALPETFVMWWLVLTHSRAERSPAIGERSDTLFPLLAAILSICLVGFIGDNLGTNGRLRMLAWNLATAYLCSSRRRKLIGYARRRRRKQRVVGAISNFSEQPY